MSNNIQKFQFTLHPILGEFIIYVFVVLGDLPIFRRPLRVGDDAQLRAACDELSRLTGRTHDDLRAYVTDCTFRKNLSD